MLNKTKIIYKAILISCLIIICYIPNLFAQGQYLRGEKWKKFNTDGKSADFFVAPNGNDNWSGKLADPNEMNTDGPFKTIRRAQVAVRELKKLVYTPEEIPIEINYIGSPHELGDGRDILVLIRGGYYSLEETLLFSADDGGERVETNMPTGAFEYHKLKDYFITYAAYPNERPIISGGQRIKNWKKNEGSWVAETDLKKAGTRSIRAFSTPVSLSS